MERGTGRAGAPVGAAVPMRALAARIPASVRALVAAQRALQEDPSHATAVGRKLFPKAEAELIAELIRRDAPFYDSAISEEAVQSMNAFARGMGLLSRQVGYADVVWKG